MRFSSIFGVTLRSHSATHSLKWLLVNEVAIRLAFTKNACAFCNLACALLVL